MHIRAFYAVVAVFILSPHASYADEIRNWTDVNGRTMTGELLRVDHEKKSVQIKSNDTFYELQFKRFSQADLEYIESFGEFRGFLQSSEDVAAGKDRVHQERIWRSLPNLVFKGRFNLFRNHITSFHTESGLLTVPYYKLSVADQLFLDQELSRIGRSREVPRNSKLVKEYREKFKDIDSTQVLLNPGVSEELETAEPRESDAKPEIELASVNVTSSNSTAMTSESAPSAPSIKSISPRESSPSTSPDVPGDLPGPTLSANQLDSPKPSAEDAIAKVEMQPDADEPPKKKSYDFRTVESEERKLRKSAREKAKPKDDESSGMPFFMMKIFAVLFTLGMGAIVRSLRGED